MSTQMEVLQNERAYIQDSDDTLSLRDLPINDYTAVDSLCSSPRTSSSARDLFEFSFDSYRSTESDSIFSDTLVPYQCHSSACLVSSSSFRRDARFLSARIDSSSGKVNITSLTSMSAKSRRRMFMFGPVKFKPEMELSAIRERQGRRAPSSLFPAVVVGGDGTVGTRSGKERCSHSSHWGLVRTLRCRAQRDYLSTVLARSLGCIPSH